MSEMVERVARTICREEHVLRFGRDAWRAGELEAKVENFWRDHLPVARAAIEAMREPSAEMLEAASLAVSDRDTGLMPYSVYTHMIDAALSEDAA